MTDLSKKMDSIAKSGYRVGMARHILKGQKRIRDNDYEPLIADINDEMKHLTLHVLTELYEHVKYLRKRQQILPAEAPDCPRSYEQEVDDGP